MRTVKRRRVVLSMLLILLMLGGWVLLTLALQYAEYGTKNFSSGMPGWRSFFYQPFTLWSWLAGTVLVVPVLWFVGRSANCGAFGIPQWTSISNGHCKAWIPVTAFWVDTAAITFLIAHRLWTGTWSYPILAMVFFIVCGWALLLLAAKTERERSPVSWKDWSILIHAIVSCAIFGYIFYEFKVRYAWYPALLGILVASLACALYHHRSRSRAVGMIVAVALAALSAWLFFYGKTYFPITKATSCLSNPLYYSVFVWLASLIVLVVAFYIRRDKSEQRKWQFDRWEYVFLGILILVAAILRIWNTSSIPPELHLDEANEGLAALRILSGAQKNPLGLGAFHHNNLPYHLFAGGLLLFEDRIAAIRLVAALSGLLAVPLLYLMVREMFGRLPAVLSSLFLCTAYFAIQFARAGLGNAHTVPFSIAISFFLWRALSPRGRDIDFMWFGLLLAISQYGLPAMRVIVVFIAMFILYMLCVRPRQVLSPARGWAVALVAALVTATPLLASSRAMDFAPITKRANEVVIWSRPDKCRQESYKSNPQLFIWTNRYLKELDRPVKASLSQFLDVFPCMFFGQDTSGQFHYRKGLLDFWTGVLFLGGMTFSFFSWHRPKYALLNFWYWSTLMFGGAFTIDPPFSPRLVPLIPVLAVWPGVMLAKTAQRLTTWGSIRLRKIAVIVSCAVVLAIGAYNYYLYFYEYVGKQNPYFGSSMTMLTKEYIWTLNPKKVKIVMVNNGMVPWGSPTFRYLASEYEGELYRPLKGYLPFREPVKKDVVFIATPNFFRFLDSQPAKFYPGGTFSSLKKYGKDRFKMYYVTREQINEQYEKMVQGEGLPPPPPPPPPKRDSVLKQDPPAQGRGKLPKGAAAIQDKYPGWTVIQAANDKRVGISKNDHGRQNTIVLHPISRSDPAVIEWRGKLASDMQHQLSFDASAHPPSRQADTQMRIYVNDKLIDERFLGPWDYKDSPWHTFSYNLSAYAGQEITLQIWNVANGYYYEFLHIANLRLDELEKNDDDSAN